MLVAQTAKWVDIDGPLLLARDRDCPVSFERGVAFPPPAILWG
jgi:hypothetical protein